ncbi:MAG: D-glycero-alpha-D-manno-heptose-1,7-bisphosphate 7-phosphatase [Myxococcales bacterium]
MASVRGLVILDRDGVLNEIVVDAEHGTIDSPLHPDQVRVYPWVPESLAALTAAGYLLAVATNQPSAAKGKTTRANLEATHARVLELAQASGGRIASSHVCFHRSEDGCACRKPKPALLLEALATSAVPAADAWMVGDGVTDVEAGVAAGVHTAFLGPRKCDACKIFSDRRLSPGFWGKDLADFTRSLLSRA